MKLLSLAFLNVVHIAHVLGSVTFQGPTPNDEVTIPVYQGLHWDILDETSKLFSNMTDLGQKDESFLKSLPIIRMDTRYKDFNPCDVETFRPHFIAPLLNKTFQMTDADIKDGWIAIADAVILTRECEGLIPLHLFYSAYVVLNAQRLGARGAIWAYPGAPGLLKTNVPPDVEITEEKTGTVFGVAIHITLLLIRSDSALDSVGNYESNLYFKKLLNSVEFDENSFESLLNPIGPYRIAWLIFGILSIFVTLFIMLHAKDVVAYYKPNIEKPALRMALQMRLLILLPELLNGIVRVAASVDPIGIFYIYNFYWARFLFNLSGALSTFTDIVTIFYCYDVYNIYKASRQMQNAVPFLLKYQYGIWIILSFAFFMLVLDQVILYFGLIGALGSTTTIFPILYIVIVNIIVINRLLNVAKLMKKEVLETLKFLVKIHEDESVFTDTPPAVKRTGGTYNNDGHRSSKAALTTTTTTNTVMMQMKSLKRLATKVFKKSDPAHIIPSSPSVNKDLLDNHNNTALSTVTHIPGGAVSPTAPAAAASGGGKKSESYKTGSSKMRKTASKSSTTANAIAKTENILLMRKYIIWVIWGRILMFITVSMVAIGVATLSAFNYAVTLLLLVSSSSFSSYAQILAALKLPHSRTSVGVHGTTGGGASGSRKKNEEKLNKIKELKKK